VNWLSFEVTCKDLLGRIGRIDTKSGRIETPHLLPVVNPLIQPISSREILTIFKCNAIITNAYLVRKNFRDEALAQGIHRLLRYDGVVVTDSGAYQILEYGHVDVEPEEIVRFQEAIGTDIGVILDIPTGWSKKKSVAEYSVRETIRRADLSLKLLTRSDILWEGPIQGGVFLDLVARSAREMSRRPFDIYSLGSPTPIMERYMFDRLVDMIMTAKMILPLSKPLHLFGAGHPMMLALATALGCDLFDSASYAIFARQGRYLTETGTLKLSEIEYFPCSCPICQTHTPAEVKMSDRATIERKLAEHNLHVCLEEIKRVKQAILEGRLWELLETRARSHPSLLQALSTVKKYGHFIEKHTPTTKPRGLFYVGPCGLYRPELLRHRIRMTENYSRPRGATILVLLPFNRGILRASDQQSPGLEKLLTDSKVHVCLYGTPYSLIPIEISDVYPLAQTEFSDSMDSETEKYALDQIRKYVTASSWKAVIVYATGDSFSRRLVSLLRRLPGRVRRRVQVTHGEGSSWSMDASMLLLNTARKRHAKGRN